MNDVVFKTVALSVLFLVLFVAATPSSPRPTVPLPSAASITQSGLVSTGVQTFEGKKIFDGGIQTAFVDAGLVVAEQVIADVFDGKPSAIALFRARVTSGVAFSFFTASPMTSGTLMYVSNQFQPMFTLDYAGNATFAGGGNFGNSIIVGTSVSGEVSLMPGEGEYAVIGGRLYSGYWGQHGQLTVIAVHPAYAGYLAEFHNNHSGVGATSDFVFGVTWAGGLMSFAGWNVATLPPCGSYENHAANDGGTEWLTNFDAGVQVDGTLLFAADQHRWYQCVVTGPGTVGTWTKVLLSGDQ